MKGRYPLMLVLLLAAALRVGLLYVSTPAGRGCPDSLDYIALAEGMRQDGCFCRDGQAEIFRTPGYPLLLMLLESAGPGGIFALQILLDVLLVYLTYRLGRFFLGQGCGVLAAAFQAISPLAVAASCRVLSDSLYAFMFTASLLLMVGHLRRGGWRTLIGSAAVLSLACYVRPLGGVMAGLFMLVLLFRPMRFRRVAMFAGVFVACLAPWVVRNAAVADYRGFSSYAGESMYFFAAAELRARSEGCPAEEIRMQLRRREIERRLQFPDETVGATARRRQAEAVRIIGCDLRAYAKIHFKGCLWFWLPGATDVLEVGGLSSGNRGTADVLHRHGLVAAVRHYFGGNVWAAAAAVALGLILLVKYLAVGVYVVGRGRLRMPPEVWLMLVVVAVSAVLPGPFGLPRYRLPIEPLLSVAAAAGLACLHAKLFKKMTKLQ